MTAICNSCINNDFNIGINCSYGYNICRKNKLFVKIQFCSFGSVRPSVRDFQVWEICQDQCKILEGRDRAVFTQGKKKGE